MRFFKGLIVGMVSLSVLWLLLIYMQRGKPTVSSQWIADVYEHKMARAKSIEGTRLFIVGGSASLFGLNSQILETTYGLPTTNLGVNAGLLLPYVLLKSKTVLRKNDIVIMPLEYHFYVYDGKPNIQMIDQIFSRDPKFFKYLTFQEQAKMLWHMTSKRLYDGFMAKGGQKSMMGPYGYTNLNAYGDQTHTSEAEAQQWAYDWENLQKELPRRYGHDTRSDTLSWKWLQSYITWAKKEGICLIFTPPTMVYDAFYETDLQEKKFYTSLKEKVEALGGVFIGEPYAYMYDRKYYFNTEYHLNETGRNIWTENLMKDLGPDLRRNCSLK